MSQIKQMLLLKKQGVSNRKIATAVGMNKETVNNYMKKVNADSLSIDELLKLEDPELEYRLKGGNPAYTDERFEKFKELLPYLESEMQRKHVTLQLLWEEYRRDNPDGYSLTQFRFHYRQNATAKKERPGTVMKDLYVGGEKLYLDFAGDRLGYVDVETGEIKKVQTLPDNLKAAVIKADRYTPSINKVMEDMANHYGTVVIPTRPVHPKDKPNAEGFVKIAYRRVYAELRNEVFHSLEELNAAVASKTHAHNQKRMQQRPYTREEQFLAIERPNLLPLPQTDFEIKYYTNLKVAQNCCIYLGRDKHYYSVPYQYIGQEARVIYTRTLVKVFIDGKPVCTHIRDRRPGQYTIVKEHLASNSQAYRDRSPQYYIDKGYRVMPELGDVIKYIFYTSKMPPETHYKTCEALLSFQRQTDPVIFRKACETALACQRYNYGFIKQLVKSKCAAVGQPTTVQAPPQHTNVRGKEQFL